MVGQQQADPASPEAFQEAVDDYRAAQGEFNDVARQLHINAESLRILQRELVDLEAGVRLGHVFVGKNAEERAAELRMALREDTPYQSQLAGLDLLQASIQFFHDGASSARDRMALAKRMMDYSIARTQFLAKEGGEIHD